AARSGEVASHAEADLGEVHGGHLPALLGQPYRVSAGPAGEVERPHRRQPRDLGDEEAAGGGRRDAIGLRVAAVPALALAVRPRHRRPVARPPPVVSPRRARGALSRRTPRTTPPTSARTGAGCRCPRARCARGTSAGTRCRGCAWSAGRTGQRLVELDGETRPRAYS